MIERLRILFLTAALILPLASTAIVHAQAPTEGAAAQAEPHRGGEASLVLPDLSTETFQGINGRTLLMGGLAVCLLGLALQPGLALTSRRSRSRPPSRPLR